MSLVSSRDDGVQVLTLNRPEAANAIDRQTHEQLVALLAEAEADAGVSAVVLAARGERAFSAGADLKEYADLPRAEAGTERRRLLTGTLLALLRFPKPLVCAVQARAIGAGLFVVLCADLVLSAPAVRFSLPEGRLGMPSPIGAALLEGRCGPAAARRMVLLGQDQDAPAMLALGLVDEIASGAELHATARSRASALGACDARAYRENKRWMNETVIERLLAASGRAQALQDALNP